MNQIIRFSLKKLFFAIVIDKCDFFVFGLLQLYFMFEKNLFHRDYFYKKKILKIYEINNEQIELNNNNNTRVLYIL